ncbi:MAG: sulfite exporter TauE/SafE family protein [Stellaceae bacterium]
MIIGVDPLYSLAGFVVGVLVGLTGVGGGSMMTPALVLLFGIDPAIAVGTDLLYASITKGAGTVVHGLNHTVDWRMASRLALGSVPATALTLAALQIFSPKSHSSPLISVVLGVALILTAISLLLRKQVLRFAARKTATFTPRRTFWLTVATGVVLGFLVSLSSVGAGAIGITALIILYPEIPTARIVGSDIAHSVPLTLLAGCGHWIMGTVDGGMLGFLVLGSLPGIVLGSQLSARVPDAVLRVMLAVTLLLVGGRLVL